MNTKKTAIVAASMAFLGMFALCSSNVASATWKRGSATGCTLENGGMQILAGVLSVLGPTGGRTFTDAAECAYPDDSTFPHGTVNQINLHGSGQVTFMPCTKFWNGASYSCSSPKASGGGTYATSFFASDLTSSWRQGGAGDANFPYIEMLMVEGSGAQFWGWWITT